MGQQNSGTGIGQSQMSSMVQQQTPNLVAQLQRTIPSAQGMMAQQFSHQPPPY